MNQTICSVSTIARFATKTPSCGAGSIIERIFKEVDQANGVIVGSLIHKYLSKLNYKCNDIDIFMPSLTALQQFLNSVHKLLTDKKIRSYDSRTPYMQTYKLGQDIGRRMQFQCNNGTQRVFSQTIKFKYDQSRIIINVAVLPLNTKFNMSYVEFLKKHVLLKKFLCNIYSNGVIYHQYKDVKNVKVSLQEFVDRSFNQQMIKYASRGVIFAIEDTNKIIANRAKLEEANRYYRSKGMIVIPLSRNDNLSAGKAPMRAQWQSMDQTYSFTVSDDIANIGLLCGPDSGIVCIDVDNKDSGIEIFDELVKKYGLPKGPVQSTGNGGFHYIFKFDNSRMADMKAKVKCTKFNNNSVGIDMWIQKCQFVAEPSINYITGKEYKWISPIDSYDSIPEMPEWLYKLYDSDHISEDFEIISANVPIAEAPIHSTNDLGQQLLTTLQTMKIPQSIINIININWVQLSTPQIIAIGIMLFIVYSMIIAIAIFLKQLMIKVSFLIMIFGIMRLFI